MVFDLTGMDGAVLSAQAEVNRSQVVASVLYGSALRAGGGEPVPTANLTVAELCSPRRRR